MVLEIDHRQASCVAGSQADHAQPVGGLRRDPPVGTQVEGEVKNITEFGLFVGLDNDIDGMVHLSDLTWEGRGEDVIQNFRKGDMVKAVVTEVDTDKERISLSIKAVDGDPFADAIDGVKRGSVITVEVTAIEDGGIEVDYNGMKSFIRRSDLSRDRAETAPRALPDRRQGGCPRDQCRCALPAVLACRSRPARSPREKEAVEQYGSSDSGASLGDILGRRAPRRTND